MIVGFWIRLLSDLIDQLLLLGLGWILSVLLKLELNELGENAGWLGITISFIYVGLLQSFLGNGQSFGKKILGLQVLSLDGKKLSVIKSFLRYSVLALVFYKGYFRGYLISLFSYSLLLSSSAVSFTYFVMIGCISLVIFHPLKRGIHDMVAGSVVVKKDTYNLEAIGKYENKKRSLLAYSILGGEFLIFILFLTGLLLRPHGISESVRDAENIQVVLLNNSSLKSPSVWTSGGKKENFKNFLIVNGFLSKKDFDNETYRDLQIQDALKTVLVTSRKLKEIDQIRIFVRSGFDIGIAKAYQYEREDFTPDGKKVSEESGKGNGID
jgi:uncharacterized RDD family membrane protein YckC